MNDEGLYYNDCEEYKTIVFLLNRAVGINTFSRWSFWLFRRSHRYFLLRDDFLWRHLRHFKDIGNLCLEKMKKIGDCTM